jgi:hypothetical protein
MVRHKYFPLLDINGHVRPSAVMLVLSLSSYTKVRTVYPAIRQSC